MKRLVVAVLALMIARSSIRAQIQEGSPRWLEDFEKRFPPIKKNAAAEDVERLSLALGLDPWPSDSGAEHPTQEDQEAYRQAGAGGWLDEQVKASDDSIAAPPAKLKEFLEKRRSVLQRVVGLLEKEIPEWGFDLHESPKERRDLILAINLGRILLSAALVEEQLGHHAGAGELLDASWSLYRSMSSAPDLMPQLIATAIGSRQAGVLRKMTEPGFEWANRLAGDSPLARVIEAFRVDPLIAYVRMGRSPGQDSFSDPYQRAWNAFADRVAELSSCELPKRSYEEIRQSVEVRSANSEQAEQLRIVKEIALPNLMNALHRAARLAVDLELTAKILELRQEKAALRRGRWPEKFFDVDSRVCPGASYEYQPRGMSMSIRFKGSIAEPAPLVLPLSFEARAPRPTPTSTPARAPRAASSRAPRS